ncbi:MAG: hypothetical protein ABUL62_11400 [Myxococcales bacterium]
MSQRFRRTVALGGWGLLLAACNVATVDQAPSSVAQNSCTGDAECGGGSCVSGQCRSRVGDIHTILLEVTPPADGSLNAGTQFLKPDIALPSAGSPLTIDLDLVSQIVGQVRVSDNTKACGPKFLNDSGGTYVNTDDSSISAFVTFVPSSTSLGLYSPYAVVKSQVVKDSYFAFSVNVPPGDYDIYVEPGSQADESCPVPPQLRRAQHPNGGTLRIELPDPSTFDLDVSWPSGDHMLDGWHADMVDPVSGRVISNRVPLALRGKDYLATISYFPVVIGETVDKAAGELVRLSPPDNVTAPTILLERSGLSLVHANSGTLSNLSLPGSVTLQGQVAAQSTPRPVAATVTLAATKIAGMDPGIPASFVRSVPVGSDGQFTVDVLPGTYLVAAVPSTELSNSAAGNLDPDSMLAAVTQEWVVPSSPSVQAGRVVSLGASLPINGVATDSSNTGMATALVEAAPSPASLKSNVLRQLLPNSPALCQGAALESELCKSLYVPRASTGVVDKDGGFVGVRADPGTFDVTVRPSASTGFGWLLFPGVSVGPTSAGPTLDGKATPAPIAYSGTVSTPGADPKPTVPNALLRAYIYLSKGRYVDDSSKADSVLQVAETRSNNDGSFEILIPTTVNAPLP